MSKAKTIAIWVPWATPPKQTLRPYITKSGTIGWYQDHKYEKIRKQLGKLIYEAFVKEGYTLPIKNTLFIKGIFFRDNFPCNSAELIGFITDAIENYEFKAPSGTVVKGIIVDRRQVVGHWGFIARGTPDKEAGTYIEIKLDPPQPKLFLEVRAEKQNGLQEYIARKTSGGPLPEEVEDEMRAIESAEEPL